MVLKFRSTITLQKHRSSILIRGVMPRKEIVRSVAVTLAALLGVCGAVEEAVRDSAVRGGLRLIRIPNSINLQPAAPTRQGSLTFIFDPEKEPNSTRVFHRVRNEKLKRIDPSVECRDNKMTLKVRRVSAMHFLVDNGEKPLPPLAHMPPNCGFIVKRSRRDVQFDAPYQGCHVTQQGDEYTLPLRLWGKPMTMSCPAMLPSPSVFCFPSGMVVKVGGMSANDLTVKVSKTWQSLSSASDSCGLIVEVIPGGLTLTAPYSRDLCTEKKADEHLLTLLWADVEFLVTCPSVPNIKPTIATVTPPSGSGPTLLHPLYPGFPQFPPKAVPTTTSTPTTTLASVQHLEIFSAASVDKDTNKDMPFVEDITVTIKPQYLRLPRPLLPMQAPATKKTFTPPDQSSKLLLSQQYLLSILPKYPILVGNLPLTTASPPATSTKSLRTSPEPTTEHKIKPQVPQHAQSDKLFLSFLRSSPTDHTQAAENHKPVNQQLKAPEHVYTQTYQVPVLHPPSKYFSEPQMTQTATPTTTSTTSTPTTQTPGAPKLFYHPHPYMEVYYAPQLAALPVLPDLPTTPSTHKAQPDQQQTVSRAVPPLQHAFSHQLPKPGERVW